jgi:hypothetical protein
MIREVVEQHAPPGSVPSREAVEPPFVREAEALFAHAGDRERRRANCWMMPT